MREVRHAIVGKTGHARWRLQDEAAVPGDLLFDLLQQLSLIHAGHLTSVFLKDPLRLAVDLRFLLKIFSERFVNALFELGRSLARREKLLFDERRHQSGGGSAKLLVLGKHPPLIPRSARLDNPRRPPIVGSG